MKKQKKDKDRVRVPEGAACAARIAGASWQDDQELFCEASWTLRVYYPCGRAEERQAVFTFRDAAETEDFLRELDAFGVTLEHADDVYDALCDAIGKTAALSAPPDEDGRCARAALPRRRWRPTPAQRSHRRDNYGFDRPRDEYGESRYAPREEGAEPALQRGAAAGPSFGRAWSFGA